jgi:hypothetical protein
MSKLKYGLVWLASMTLASLIVQKLVLMLFAQSWLARTEPGRVDLVRGLAAAFTEFWDLKLAWQGGGEFWMATLIVFGITSGLLRHKGWVRLVPLLLGVAFIVSLPFYAAQITYLWTGPYWEQMAWRIATLLAIAGSGIALDKALATHLGPMVQEVKGTALRGRFS